MPLAIEIRFFLNIIPQIIIVIVSLNQTKENPKSSAIKTFSLALFLAPVSQPS